MKKKLIPLMLASSLALGATFTLASCAGKNVAEEMLKSLIIQNDGQTISKDFKVTASLKKGENTYNLLWSSNSEYLKVAEEAKDNYYDITVTRPEDNAETVKLTAELDVDGAKSTKEFTFHVSPLDVNDFIEGFKFAQKGALVDSDFDLPQSFTIGSKTAQITWKSNSTDLITISADGKTANVLGAAPKETAQLQATFSYKNVTGSDVYSVIVTRKSTAFEKLRNWYINKGISQEIKGYIVGKDVFSTQYNNTSVYISDENAEGGYYVYRVKCDQATYDKLTFGTLVTVTGSTNTNYNGLIELQAGATITVDESAEKKTKAQLVRNIDEDLIANTTDLFYKESSLVQLNGWKVKSIDNNAKDKAKYVAGTTLNIITLTKKVDNKDIDIKVVANAYVDLDDDTKTALAATCTGLNTGDIVNVNGILGYYNKDKVEYDRASYQINVTDAQSIVKSTEQESTYADAPVVAKAISDVSAKIPARVYENTDLNLDQTTDDGVSITWDFSTTADLYVPKTATFNAGKTQLNIRPVDKKDEVVLVGKFTKGSYTVEEYYNIETINKTPAAMVGDAVIQYRKTDKLKANLPGTYDLLTLDTEYKKVTLSYEILEQKDSNGNTDNIAEIVTKGNKTQLVIGSVDRGDTHTIKYRVTFTCPDGENQPQTQTADFTLTITNEKIISATSVATPEAGKSYVLGAYQGNLKDFYFFDGKVSGNYLTAATGTTAGVNVTVNAAEGGKYTLSFKNAEGKTKYIGLKDTKASNATGNVVVEITDNPFAFDWNSKFQTFTAVINKDAGPREFYISANDSYKTLGAQPIANILKSNYFKSGLYTTIEEKDWTRDEKNAIEKGLFTIPTQLSGDTYTVPTAALCKDVDITVALKAGETNPNGNVSADGKSITFNEVTAESKLNVTVTFKCGGKTATKDVEITISPEVKTAEEFLGAIENNTVKLGDRVAVTGLVTAVAADKLTVSDGTNTFYVYGKINKQDYSNDLLGKVIRVNGTYTIYAGATIDRQVINPVIISQTVDNNAIMDYVKTTIADTINVSEAGTVTLPTTTPFSNVTVVWKENDVALTNNEKVVELSANEQTFNLVAEISVNGEGTVLVTTKQVVLKVASQATSAFMKYVNASANVTPGSNYAADFGLDPNIFNVDFGKGTAQNNPYAVKDSVVRLYAVADGTGSSMTITINSTYVITSIIITYEGQDQAVSTVTGADALTIATTGTPVVQTINYENGQTVVIQNTGASKQVRISSIEIKYQPKD